ncbi:MAG: Acetyl esterase/lipase, partial [Marmoricola sp.]|nr:Acetyl esterase/lipase [Marmoricola sp.]
MDPAAFPNLDPDLVDLVLSLPDMAGALDDVPAARAMLAGLIPDGTPYDEDELVITDEIAPGSPDVAVRVYRPRTAGPG